MKTNYVKIYKSLFVFVWCAFVAVCAYFAIHNAQWLGGDEAIVISHTGWASPFIPPQVPFSYARFFPFSYSLYNVLLMLPHGEQISPTAIYALHSTFMIVYALMLSLLAAFIMKDIEDKWKYPILLLITIFAIGRIYPEIITCYTGVWIVLTLLPVFLICAYLFHTKQQWVYGIMALLVINYIIYCYETVFTIPMALGACMLLFSWKSLSKKEKIFDALLVASALLFLLLYVILVIPKIENAYQGDHGAGVTWLGNALHIFIAQKTIWVIALLLIIRIWDMLKHKSQFCFFDALLLASCAYCCGAATLKLNFVYYYNVAVITAIPAILYFALHYIKPQGALILFLCLALFYGRKMPSVIRSTQKARTEYTAYLSMLANEVNNSQTIYWYAPNDGQCVGFDLEQRCWICGYIETALGWTLKQRDYRIKQCDTFDGAPGIWMVLNNDETSFYNVVDLLSIKRVSDMNRYTCFWIQE